MAFTRETNVHDWDPDDFFVDQENSKKASLSTLVRYRTDAVLERSYRPACADSSGGNGVVSGEPSKRSLQNLCFLLNNCDVPMSSMLTLTMTPQVHRQHSPSVHKSALKASLERLRKRGTGQYCWVREHQENGSVHWHIFTDDEVGEPGEINEGLTRDWIDWFAGYYEQRNANAKSVRNMKNGNFGDFRGCARFESLKTEAAGRYAGKEGAKRFQKQAPVKWRKAGCAWWRASRGVKCTPIETIDVLSSTVQGRIVTINGVEREVAFKVQFNQGVFPC